METDLLSDSRKTVGVKATLKALKKEQVEYVFIAVDAEKKVLDDLIDACSKAMIPCQEYGTMAQLGKACAIQVGTSAIGMLKK
ncbi:MAG: ribosomal L7Ae/L30e/S12e/Gadd45 family protein [Clostridiales bacterium]